MQHVRCRHETSKIPGVFLEMPLAELARVHQLVAPKLRADLASLCHGTIVALGCIVRSHLTSLRLGFRLSFDRVVAMSPIWLAGGHTGGQGAAFAPWQMNLRT